MIKNNELKSFLISRIFGLILIALSIFIILSLVYYSKNDPTYGNFNSLNINNNPLGTYGSHLSGILMIALNNLSYIVPIFFLISGIKKIFGYSYKYFFLRFISFLFGLCLLNLFLTIVGLNNSLVGNFLLNITFDFIGNDLTKQYTSWTFLISIFVVAFIFLFYSLSIKFSLILSLFKKTFSLLNFFLKLLKLFKLPNTSLSKKLLDKEMVNKIKKQDRQQKEPTIQKSKFYNNIRGSETKSNYSNEYSLPPLTLLKTTNEKNFNLKELEKKNLENAKKLEKILREYGVDGQITNFKTGPVITLFEFITAAGIKTSKVIGLSEDIARAMASVSTRISSQPGKSTIGIEIPNNVRQEVCLGDLLKDENFNDKTKYLTLALGKNISGEKKYTDLEKMPHLLIAGTTGSGKSVAINSMILSLLFKFKPSECKLILIDPKILELSIYENIPHLLSPVVTNPNKAVFALKWVVKEMENRHKLMSSTNVKNIRSFNEKISSTLSRGEKLYKEVQTGIDNETSRPIIEKREIPLKKMPLIVVVIDEMADLMMVAGKEVENLVQRLAQAARASGIHLITATQRPSVDVITGTIKANFPSRISFRVASRFDSRTIINEMGAEQLLGSGDMLFLENGANLVRLHGGYVSEKEIENVVNYIKSQSNNEIQMDIIGEVKKNQNNELNFNLQSKNVDNLYDKAVSIVIDQQKVSTSFIQRYLQIGYNRAARIVEQMEEDGIISEPTHAGKRSVFKKQK